MSLKVLQQCSLSHAWDSLWTREGVLNSDIIVGLKRVHLETELGTKRVWGSLQREPGKTFHKQSSRAVDTGVLYIPWYMKMQGMWGPYTTRGALTRGTQVAFK